MSGSEIVFLVFLAPAVAGVGSFFVIKWMLGPGVGQLPVDIPNPRSMHLDTIPRGGGVAIVIGTLAVLALVGVTDHLSSPLVLSALTLILFALVGWFDDLRQLSVWFRLAFQSLFGIGLVLFFGSPETVIIGGHPFALGFWWYVFSIPAVIWLINLYNFMDGIDGIAGLQTFIAALAYAGLFFLVGESAFALVWLGLASATLVFLWFNWSPASLFMGDSGSLAIGALFASGIVFGVTQLHLSLSVLLLPLGLFIVDATSTLIRRVGARKSPFEAHRDHLYQRAARCWGHPATALCSGVIVILLSLLCAVDFIDYPPELLWPLIGLMLLFVVGGAVFILTQLHQE